MTSQNLIEAPTMPPVLSLFEDTLANDSGDVRLPAAVRMIFVVHGSATIDGKPYREDEAWHGEGEALVQPGEAGITCRCWELTGTATNIATRPGVSTHQKIAAQLDTLPSGDLLPRGDSVAFPPDGCAYRHTHQGPGMRCLIEGAIRIDTHGRSTSYGPGGAWYESGPEPVFAQAAPDRPSRFIRVMILPRARIGKSSIRYVNAEDAAKPKTQQYKIFVDAPINLAPG